MTPETIQAIRDSIAHWEQNRDVKTYADIGIGSHHCPLCKLYINNRCRQCPVYEKTTYPYCQNTPYEAIYTHVAAFDYSTTDGYLPVPVTPEWPQLCQDEIDFLTSLLPSSISHAKP